MLVSKPLKSKQQPEESGGQCSLTVIVANIFLVHERSSFPPELKAEEPHNELHSTILVLLSDQKYNLKWVCGGENLKQTDPPWIFIKCQNTVGFFLLS